MNYQVSMIRRLVAVLVVVALGIPFMQLAPRELSVVENASAAATEVKVGWLSEITVWNPMDIEMVEDYVACFLRYACLWTYDQDWNGPVNDLVKSYTQTVNPNGSMTTVVDITPHAYFRSMSNPSDTSRPLTAYAVKYTIDRIHTNQGGAWDVYVKDISVKVNSRTQFELWTPHVRATLIDDLSDIPIINPEEWNNTPDNKFLAEPTDPTAAYCSGPFLLSEINPGVWYRFIKAPNYFGEIEYPGVREVNIGSILISYYGDPGALTLLMNSGKLDTIALLGQPNLYINTLGSRAAVNIIKQAVQEPGICDVAINAIPMEIRVHGGGNPWGFGNPLLLDPIVREAVFMTLNKDSIVNNIMYGLATKADSVIQPNFWHKDIDPEVPYDPLAAMNLLLANGYSDTDNDNYLEATAAAYPVQQQWANEGDELAFRCHAPNNEPSYVSVGRNWVDWAKPAGIKLLFESPSENIMTMSDWYKADYDIWVWHWGWGPEPLSDLSVWLSENLHYGGDNCQMPMGPWYKMIDPAKHLAFSAFDENFTLAQQTVDKDARKVLVDRLQQFVYDSYTEITPFYDLGLYAFTDERFTGWGDWVSHPGRSTLSDLLWLWFDLEPVGNVKPIFDTQLNEAYTIVKTMPQTFTVMAYDLDGDPLTVNWTFGDGTPMVQQTSGAQDTKLPVVFTITHTYTTVRNCTVNVTAWDGRQDHQKVTTSTALVIAAPNNVPRFTSAVTANPAQPRYVGTSVTWSVSGQDDESKTSGFGLRFTWDWGDGTYTTTDYRTAQNGQVKTDTHAKTWNIPGTYNVQIWIWDGWADPEHNVSSGVIPYTVIENTPPTTPSLSPITGYDNTWIACSATSSDADVDSIRFTWDWGDGTYNVTNVLNSVPGTTLTSSVMHKWAAPGTYTVIVHVDDRTGMSGHNVTNFVDAVISSAVVNVAPSGLQLQVETLAPHYVGDVLTFNGSAIDSDADALSFYLDFGDGTGATASTPGGTAARQYVSPKLTHSYSSATSFTARLWVNDGQGHNVSTTTAVNVIANSAPAAPTISPIAGAELTWVTCIASSSDADPESVRVTWNFGNGSYNVTNIANPTPGSTLTSIVMYAWPAAGNYLVTVTVDDLTGLGGHNRSGTTVAVVTAVGVNVAPTALQLLIEETGPYYEGEVVTFNASAIDTDSDALTLFLQFGDGQQTTMTTPGGSAMRQYASPKPTHSYASASTYTATLWVNDGQGHNVSTTLAVIVIANSAPAAPTISPISGTESTWISCSASTSEADPEGVRVTWAWGNGTFNVTTHANPTPGSSITSGVMHSWTTPGNYAVTVYVDDLTGSPGHNVSATVVAGVFAIPNVAPSGLQLAIEATPPFYVGTSLTFNVSAVDGDSDALTFYLEFGDGKASSTSTIGGTTSRQYVDPKVSFVYLAANTYTMTLWANDGHGHNVSMTQDVTVSDVPVNQPPWLLLPTLFGAHYNHTLYVVPTQCVDNDTDPLVIWFNWGDGTITKGNATFVGGHVYKSTGYKTLTVWVNDSTGPGKHNVSKTASVNVIDNLEPQFVGAVMKKPLKVEYNISETIVFNVSFQDYEGDQVTVTIQFGDGTVDTEICFPAPHTNHSCEFSHTYAKSSDAYRVNCTVRDNKTGDHYQLSWATAKTTVKVVEAQKIDKKGLPTALIAGVALAAIVALLLLVLFLRRRKGDKEEKQQTGGMEGMAPPEPEPPADKSS